MDISKELPVLYKEYQQKEQDILFETDVLTGCLHRLMLFKALDAHEFDGASLGLICFDIIGVSQFNDIMGIPTGDELICRTTANIHDTLRDGMKIFRIGGDEFVITFPNCTDFELARFIDDWLALQVRKNKKQDKFICVAAVGSAWSNGNADFFELLSAADAVLREDKRRKKTIYSLTALLKSDEWEKGL